MQGLISLSIFFCSIYFVGKEKKPHQLSVDACVVLRLEEPPQSSQSTDILRAEEQHTSGDHNNEADTSSGLNHRQTK